MCQLMAYAIYYPIEARLRLEQELDLQCGEDLLLSSNHIVNLYEV